MLLSIDGTSITRIVMQSIFKSFMSINLTNSAFYIEYDIWSRINQYTQCLFKFRHFKETTAHLNKHMACNVTDSNEYDRIPGILKYEDQNNQGPQSKEIFPLLSCQCISASRNLHPERPFNRFMI